jgi:tetraacyldisaccharide 4'-kinase
VSPQAFWSRKGLTNTLLLPFSFLFGAVSALRRWAYRKGVLSSAHPGIPVIVVGNLNVGGSGKTPFVIWLVDWLKSRGFSPGVVSRGYGRRERGVRSVQESSTAGETGDEPLLIRRKTGVPVVVGADRLAAAQSLRAQHPEVDLIVSDDGLQHYRLRRDLELVMADADALFGNGWLLPAGPLREPLARLEEADALILTQRGETPAQPEPAMAVFTVRQVPAAFRNVADGSLFVDRLQADGNEIQAITAIARPQGFFDFLDRMGMHCRTRTFPDHYLFRPGEIDPGAVVVMTEKDAVKCSSFAGPGWWALELKLIPSPGLEDWLAGKLASLGK